MKNFMISLCVMAMAMTTGTYADVKKACKAEVKTAIKAEKTECKKIKDAAVKAADGNNNKRKEASDAMTACVAKAEQGQKQKLDDCMAKSAGK